MIAVVASEILFLLGVRRRVPLGYGRLFTVSLGSIALVLLMTYLATRFEDPTPGEALLLITPSVVLMAAEMLNISIAMGKERYSQRLREDADE